MPHPPLLATLLAAAALVACMPARAQLSIQPAATCTTGLTPVLGIMLKDSFSGNAGYDAAHALKDALDARGFRTVWDFEDHPLDHASIEITGRVTYWRNANGDRSTRIGETQLQVIDLTTTAPLFTLTQAAPTLVFSAPKLDAFTQGVVNTLAGRYCQSGD